MLLEGFDLRCQDVAASLPQAAQRLLAFLALHKAPLQRSYVGEVLWPESTRRRASANLRSAIWRIRQTDHDVIDPSGGRLILAKGVVVDVHELAALARQLLDRSTQWPLEGRGTELAAALSAELLHDWYDEWLLLERDRWNQLRLHALEALAERLLAIREFSQAVEAALSAVWGEPLRESAHRVLIRVYAAEGNLSDAVAQYERYRRMLYRELSVKPTHQMEELIRALTPR